MSSRWIERRVRVGLAARRGVVFSLVGILVVAAVTLDPDKARPMDAALRQVAAQPHGPNLEERCRLIPGPRCSPPKEVRRS